MRSIRGFLSASLRQVQPGRHLASLDLNQRSKGDRYRISLQRILNFTSTSYNCQHSWNCQQRIGRTALAEDVTRKHRQFAGILITATAVLHQRQMVFDASLVKMDDHNWFKSSSD
jgi:hypothetical protein